MKNLSKLLGQRIRQLRQEKGLTQEKLTYESGLGSKGYLSEIESGKKAPTLRVLKILADHLELEMIDLFTFPQESPRHNKIEKLRTK